VRDIEQIVQTQPLSYGECLLGTSTSSVRDVHECRTCRPCRLFIPSSFRVSFGEAALELAGKGLSNP